MHTENRIVIHGPVERIFELAANIHDWPRILPHYRYVIVEDESDRHKVARMSATRDGFPVKWRARQELRPDEHRILFEHIGGIRKGMAVEWRLGARGDRVHVAIVHGVSYGVAV